MRERHGRCRTSEYNTWIAMKDRCENPQDASYPRYGGRGIAVCGRWRKSFTAFLADMGQKPSPKHTIERRDNARGYEPGNCVWATRAAQNRNRSITHTLTLDGETLCLSEWAARSGVPAALISTRLRRGWNEADAVRTPPADDSPSRASKLTSEMVEEMKARRARGETTRSLAQAFGVSPAMASMVTTGKRWRHAG
jgi:hypothetical protein